jgi:hypothetical protein
MNMPAVERMVAIACWFYAALWLVASLEPSGLLGVIVAPPPVGVKYIPGGLAGAFLFAAAPIMRRQERKMGWVFAIGTVALLSHGVWLAAERHVGLGEGLLWIAIPLVIAAWVVTGSYNRLEQPDAIAPQIARKTTSPLAVLLILGVVIVMLGAVAMTTIWPGSFP